MAFQAYLISKMLEEQRTVIETLRECKSQIPATEVVSQTQMNDLIHKTQVRPQSL